MFNRLKQKWGVGPLQLTLIIFTFAIGGSLTGYASKKIISLLSLETGWLWIIIYVIIVTLLWPVAVLIISVPLGQFRFFARYIQRIGIKTGIIKKREQKSL